MPVNKPRPGLTVVGPLLADDRGGGAQATATRICAGAGCAGTLGVILFAAAAAGVLSTPSGYRAGVTLPDSSRTTDDRREI